MKNILYTLALIVSLSSFGQTADEYLSKEYFKGLKGMIEVRGKQIDEYLDEIQGHIVSFLVEKSIEKDLIGEEITIVLDADCDYTSRFERSFKGKAGKGFDTTSGEEIEFGMPCDPEHGDNCNFQLFIKQVEYKCYDLDGEDYNPTYFEPVIINQL